MGKIYYILDNYILRHAYLNVFEVEKHVDIFHRSVCMYRFSFERRIVVSELINLFYYKILKKKILLYSNQYCLSRLNIPFPQVAHSYGTADETGASLCNMRLLLDF